MSPASIDDLVKANGDMLRQITLVLSSDEFERVLAMTREAIKAGQAVIGVWAASHSACITVFVFEHRVLMWNLASAPDAETAQRAAEAHRQAFAAVLDHGMALSEALPLRGSGIDRARLRTAQCKHA